MSNIVKTLIFFNVYLEVEQIPYLYILLEQHNLANQNQPESQLKISFGEFESTNVNQNREIEDLVQLFLKNLHLPEVMWYRFIGHDLSLYDFLVELETVLPSNKYRRKLKQLIDLVERPDRKRNIQATIITLAVILGFSIIVPFLSDEGITGIQKLLAITATFPIIGIIYACINAIYSFGVILSNRNLSWFDFFKNNFFLFSYASLNIVGHSILIAAATTTTPIASFCFIFASLVKVIEEITSLIELHAERNSIEKTEDQDLLKYKQKQIRYDYEYRTKRNEILIELVAALMTSALIIIWCFVPGGITTSIVALSLIVLVQLLKSLFSYVHSNYMKDSRNSAFVSNEEACKNCFNASPAESKTLSKNNPYRIGFYEQRKCTFDDGVTSSVLPVPISNS